MLIERFHLGLAGKMANIGKEPSDCHENKRCGVDGPDMSKEVLFTAGSSSTVDFIALDDEFF